MLIKRVVYLALGRSIDNRRIVLDEGLTYSLLTTPCRVQPSPPLAQAAPQCDTHMLAAAIYPQVRKHTHTHIPTLSTH